MLAVTIVIFSFALGGLLAQRYSILALPPTTLAVLIGVVAFHLIGLTGIWSTVVMVILAAVSLQIGYFVGLTGAHLLSTRMPGKLSVYTHSTSTQNSAR